MMNNIQIVKHGDVPVAVVIPWADYQEMLKSSALAKREEREPGIPQEVMELVYIKGDSPVRAWRKFKGLTQAEAAAKAGITQAAFSQIERARKCQKETLPKIAAALDIAPELLDMID